MSTIALVTYELNQGGTNRVACHLANGFATAGHRVVVVACTSTGALDDHLRSLLLPDVEIVNLGNRAWRSRSLGQVCSFLSYCRWLRSEKPEILLATGNNISWFTALGACFSLKRSTRFFLKTTNPIIREQDSKFITRIRRIGYGLLFSVAEAVMTLSDAETRILEKQFPHAAGKFKAVCNAYIVTDREHNGHLRERSGTTEPIVVTSVGRLEYQKRFDRLIEAFAMASPDNAVLRIAGDGAGRAPLEALAKKLGIAGRVEFLGFVQDIPALLRSSDLFVLSSDYEGLPAVVVEALGCDCPVISTDCFANARDLLENIPACAVTEKNAAALGAAICSWLEARPASVPLRHHVQSYSIPSSVAGHLTAMKLSALGV